MATQMRDRPEVRAHPTFETVRVLPIALRSGEAVLVTLAGAIAVLLGILGLFGIAPVPIDGLAAIVVGAGLAIEAGAFIAAVGRSGRNAEWGSAPNTGGFTGELIFGLLGLALALFSLSVSSEFGSVNLAALSVISLGIALWTGSAAGTSVRFLEKSYIAVPDGTGISGSTWLCVFLSFGAVLLGAVSLFSLHPRTLTLIAGMVLGTGLIVSGTSKTRRVVETL